MEELNKTVIEEASYAKSITLEQFLRNSFPTDFLDKYLFESKVIPNHNYYTTLRNLECSVGFPGVKRHKLIVEKLKYPQNITNLKKSEIFIRMMLSELTGRLFKKAIGYDRKCSAIWNSWVAPTKRCCVWPCAPASRRRRSPGTWSHIVT